MPNLSERDCRPEWMDRPGLDARLHRQALSGLQRINRLSGTAHRFWRELEPLAKQRDRALRVLDVASGGGDVLVRLALRARRARVEIEFIGCDISPTAVRAAEEAAHGSGVRSVRFLQHDALSEEFPAECDVIMCSLFLHHLSDEEAEQLLRRMAAAARQAVLVDDLLRTHAGYWLAWAGCRALTRSPVVHCDGPLSVRKAFSWAELQALASRAGLADAQFSRHWPQRFFMHWSRR
jgi:2-polyprenyl-3-methyl-5-hydroxy-6-metoxy-1,4-benzoquinol methylase